MDLPGLFEGVLVVGLMTLALGVVILIKPLRALGFDRRRDGILAVTASIFLFALASSLEGNVAADVTVGQAPPAIAAETAPRALEPARTATPPAAQPEMRTEGRTGPMTMPCLDLC